jgi:DNA-binding NarL/FixJ family response regulator
MSATESPVGDFCPVQSHPSEPAESLRVLILQNTQSEAELIRDQLDRSGLSAVIERVDCEKSFVNAIEEFAPDVVVADHATGEFRALSALDILRRMRPTAPLILFADSVNGAQAVAFDRAGADDLVLKANIARLPASISNAVSVRRPLEKLTRRQIEVLKLVAQGHRTREIAKELKLSVKTVESHRGELMKRLGVRDVVSLVHYAMRVGLIPSAA